MWLSVVIVVLICLLVVVSRSKGCGRMPPEYPGALPIIGHGHLFASTPLLDLLKDIAMTAMAWGGVVRFQMSPNLTYYLYMITDPEDSVTIANSCLEKDDVYDFLKPTLGEGLVTGKVSTWKIHRKLLTPAFNQVVLDGFIEVFNSQSKKLVEAFNQSEERFDCHGLVDRNALETICLTAMGGSDAKDLFSEDYLAQKFIAEDIITRRIQRFWLRSDFIFNLSSLKKTFIYALKIIHDGSDSVIRRKREQKQNIRNDNRSEKPGTKFKAFIDLIMELSDEKGLLTDQQLREEIDTIILAGHETTALSITYTLILLGSNPDVQELVFKEISEVLGGRDVEKQDLTKLVYLEAVLKESLRLYPIAPFIARKLTHDVKITNYTLPAGSGVYISIWALNRHAMGDDAEKFVPERWLNRPVADQAAFAPFSIGKRNCIGKTYAMMAMKTTLVHLIRNFRFKADVSKLKLKMDILVKPIGGHEISIEKRK